MRETWFTGTSVFSSTLYLHLPSPEGHLAGRRGGKGHGDLQRSGREGPCRHPPIHPTFLFVPRKQDPLCIYFPLTPKQMESFHHPAGGTRTSPPLPNGDGASSPYALMPLRDVGTPRARNHNRGSIFHTLSWYSYRESPELSTAFSVHGQSVAGLARRDGGCRRGGGRGRRLARLGEVGSHAGALARRQLVDRVVATVRVQEGHLVLVGRRAAAGLRSHPLSPHSPPLAQAPQSQVVDARGRLARACAVAEQHRLVRRVAQAQLAHAHLELAQPARPGPRPRTRAPPPGPCPTARTRGPPGPGRQFAKLHRVRGALQQCTVCEGMERMG